MRIHYQKSIIFFFLLHIFTCFASDVPHTQQKDLESTNEKIVSELLILKDNIRYFQCSRIDSLLKNNPTLLTHASKKQIDEILSTCEESELRAQLFSKKYRTHGLIFSLVGLGSFMYESFYIYYQQNNWIRDDLLSTACTEELKDKIPYNQTSQIMGYIPNCFIAATGLASFFTGLEIVCTDYTANAKRITDTISENIMQQKKDRK